MRRFAFTREALSTLLCFSKPQSSHFIELFVVNRHRHRTGNRLPCPDASAFFIRFAAGVRIGESFSFFDRHQLFAHISIHVDLLALAQEPSNISIGPALADQYQSNPESVDAYDSCNTYMNARSFLHRVPNAFCRTPRRFDDARTLFHSRHHEVFDGRTVCRMSRIARAAPRTVCMLSGDRSTKPEGSSSFARGIPHGRPYNALLPQMENACARGSLLLC